MQFVQVPAAINVSCYNGSVNSEIFKELVNSGIGEVHSVMSSQITSIINSAGATKA